MVAEPVGKLVIRRLLADDDVGGFRCGDPDYDLFLTRYARKNQDRLFVGTTYVAVDGRQVVGYVTVAVGQLDREELPEGGESGLPRYPLPVLRLARLAVDETRQGEGLGRRLTAYALAVALTVRASAGCVGVVVDALPDRTGFYAELGFVDLRLTSGYAGMRPRPLPMFLPISAVAAAVAES